MGVKGNVGDVVVARDIKLYTGINSARVLTINPTLEQLQAIGINFQNPITYIDQNNDGLDRTRIDVWFKCCKADSDIILANPGLKSVEELITKVSFFLTDRFKANLEKTKLGFINSFGQSAWAENAPGAEKLNLPTETWFKSNGVRQVYDGEDVLINFIRNWVNAGREDEVFLEDVKAVIKGNAEELQSLVKPYQDNNVRIMLTVTIKDGKYFQAVYNKYFARWNSTSPLGWRKYIQQDKRNRPQGPWSYALQEYKPTDMSEAEPTPDDVSDKVQSESGKW